MGITFSKVQHNVSVITLFVKRIGSDRKDLLGVIETSLSNGKPK